MGLQPDVGRREAAILAALDGVARDVRELAAEIAGRTPTKAEYNSIQRAAHTLARAGLVTITRIPRGAGAGPGAPRSVLRKVSRWVADGDGAASIDAEMSHQQWLDAAWQAFGRDVAYAEQICEAATALLYPDELARDRGRLRGVGDCDEGAADEVRSLRVVADG